jgi:tetratricopeptide (TPR) repeat protein
VELGASPEDPEHAEGASGSTTAGQEPSANGASADRDAASTMLDQSVPIELDDVQELTPPPAATPIPPPPKMPAIRPGAPTPPPIPAIRPVVVVPPRPPMTVKVPPAAIPKPPPPPRASGQMGAESEARPSRATPSSPIPIVIPTLTPKPQADDEPSASRTLLTPSSLGDDADDDIVPDLPDSPQPAMRLRRPSGEQRRLPSEPAPESEPVTTDSVDVPLSTEELSEGGVEVGTETPNIVIDQPLEMHLETPTVVDRAVEDLGDAGMERRAATMLAALEHTRDQQASALLAYELGELYERRLADEARAVKAYGRALTLDPSLRPNLWAIRRVFYRRGLWPNLMKLIVAEVTYARDDMERADLLLEKARIAARVGDQAECRSALEEAVRIAPSHQGALLEYERCVARANDVGALLDAWELLAEAAELPARKIHYLLEIGRAAAEKDFDRARSAFDRAATLAASVAARTEQAGDLHQRRVERVARERLRVSEEHGTREDVLAAIETLASVLLAAFGPAGPSELSAAEVPARAAAIRRELIALRRRQAQLARIDNAERAWELMQQALAMAPGDSVLLNDLTELAEELGRYSELAELVQSWQAVEGDEGRAMVLSIRRADALLRGGQREQARALLASLEASAPGFIVLTSAAERDALGRADTAELAKAYLSAAHAALLGSWLGPGQPPAPDPGAAAALYVQAAELLAYEVAQSDSPDAPTALDEARAALGKALEAVPAYMPAHEALIELDDATGNIAEGIERLTIAAQAAHGEAARGVLERAIRFARAHGDLESVLELERALVALSPGELQLRWRLESTLGQLGRDDERAQLLTELANEERDATSRGTALLAAARLRERGGAVEQATDLYKQVLSVWPEDTFARESLVDLLRAQERWAELVAERRAEANTLPDGPAARRALREAAWVLEIKLADHAQAAQVYEQWLTRLPDDRTALEGIARCRGRFGDRLGEATTRRTIAELEPSPETQWLLGRALERAGQFDDAADVFRSLSVHEEQSVAATSAALALADIAAGRADTVMRVEATAALAGRTTDPRLGAALAEDSGWMYALVLEDFDRAAQSFEAATALEPTRRGALLGAALVAARRGDPVSLSAAYDGLAAAVAMPEAAAALHLRASAMSAASGDLDVANQRVISARTAAPDDTSALLVVAETTTLPVIDDAPREAAVDALLARAEVLEMRGALADDPVARASWELDRAESLELAGRIREAALIAAAVLKAHPSDVRALEAVRRMARRSNDQTAYAQASYALARVLGDPTAKLQLLREAAKILDDESSADPAGTDRAMAIYRRILQVDPGAEELGRLMDLQRARADVRGLVLALTERLTWLESEPQDMHRDDQMVPLLLERATVLHGLGDQAAAMADLDALLDRAASHSEALRFRADLAFNAGEVDYAVQLWRRCLQAETRAPRRQEIELRLAQVLAENVQDIAGAIENLEAVIESRSSQDDDIELHERMLGLCLRGNDWNRAMRELRVLARLRPTPQEKAREEMRLGLMLRDRTGDRVAARMALDRARSFDPLNLDVVRELAELVDPTTRNQVLTSTATSFRASIGQNPRSPILYDRLAQVTGWQSEVDARWLALVGLEALGTPSVDQRQVLEAGRQKLGVPQRVKLDDEARRIIRGNASGALVELWRAIAPAVQVATGVDAAKLGFVRGDKIAVKKVGEKYEPLATALAAFSVDNCEIYVSAARGGIARVLAAETPILCIGADVAAAKTSQQRWLLARAVATLAEGLATLPDLRDVELGWTLAAALKAADLAVPPGIAEEVVGEDAVIAERTKVLKKELNRKQKAVLVQIVQQRAGELRNIQEFRRAALDVGSRAGLLWAGDLALALAQLDVGKGGKALTDSPSALELTAWSVSEEHVRLRDKLGVALKGVR